MGDLKKLRGKTIGPFELYLPTNRRDEHGNLVLIEETDKHGEVKEIPEKEAEPFLKKVLFKSGHVNAAFLDAETEAEKKYEGRPLHIWASRLASNLVSWDLTDDGKAVPPTFEGIIEHGLDTDFILACLQLYNEATRPPKG